MVEPPAKLNEDNSTKSSGVREINDQIIDAIELLLKHGFSVLVR